MRIAAAIVLLLLAPASVWAQGAVLVVDPDDLGAYPDLASAVADASSGDLIQVRGGVYDETVVIDGNALTLFGEPGDQPLLYTGSLTVQNLTAGQTVVFRDVNTSWNQIRLVDNAGTVWFEQCILGNYDGDATVDADRCDNLVLVRCLVTGATFTPVFGIDNSGDALDVRQSTVTIYDCTLSGGHGFGGPYAPDIPAGDGIESVDCTLFVANTSSTGGNTGRAGGDGIDVDGSSQVTYLQGNTLDGGTGNPNGQDVRYDDGVLTYLPGPNRTFEISSPARYGQNVTLQFNGQPFELVYLPHAVAPGATFQWNGMFLIDPFQLLMFRIGILPASGSLTLNVTVPDLSPLTAVPFYSQGWFVGPGGLSLSSASMSVLLDPAY